MDLETIRKVRGLKDLSLALRTRALNLLKINLAFTSKCFFVCICVVLQNISKHKYQNRETFLSDVSHIHTNSIKYNGEGFCFFGNHDLCCTFWLTENCFYSY